MRDRIRFPVRGISSFACAIEHDFAALVSLFIFWESVSPEAQARVFTRSRECTSLLQLGTPGVLIQNQKPDSGSRTGNRDRDCSRRNS